MSFERLSRPRGLLLAIGALAVVVLACVLLWPELADAALRNAAGAGEGEGGFRRLTSYLDRLASFLIPVGGAAAVLGLIAGGFMFMAGNPRRSGCSASWRSVS